MGPRESTRTASSGWGTWWRCGASALGALLVLLVWGQAFRPLEGNLMGFNDQVGYITTARWWADSGELRSHILYPAFLDVEGWRLYMPGHYAVLALFYRLLGEGILTWLLANLSAFVFSSVGVYLIGRRIYGETTGWLGALVFALFPANISYAFTAMSEPTSVAAAVGAMAAFYYLPSRARLVAMPLLVAVPFLFRETAALLLLPMLLYAWDRPGTRRWQVVLSVVGSVLVLAGLYAWQTKTGKQSPPLSWIVLGQPNYGDLVFQRRQPELSSGEMVSALARNTLDNLGVLWSGLERAAWRRSDPLLTASIVLAMSVCIGAGLRKGRRRTTLGFGLAGGALFASLLVCHKTYAHVAIRHLLLPLPWLVLGVVDLLVVSLADRPRRRELVLVAALASVGLAAATRWTFLRAKEQFKPHPELSSTLLEKIGHDDSTLLLHPRRFGMHYVLNHYPVRWSFLPANGTSLARLAEEGEIGTVILQRVDLVRGGISAEVWARYGLREVGSFPVFDTEHVVLQRAR